MHRFRVRSKSDASKRSVPSVVPPDMPTNPPSPAPLSASASSPLLDLPPASDFRTSLILPDLSRRFTLLRGQNGEPLSIEDVRSRLALQRANGHENHVTEEEEEIMIDALIRAHNIDPTASASDSDQGYVTANGNESTFGGRYDSSELPSPVSSSSKRHSNNMFGSGRVRDQSYIRSATKSNASVTAAPKRSSRKITLSTPSAPARDVQRRRNDPPALELPTDDDEGDQTDASNSHAVSSPGQGSVTFDTYLSNSAFSPAQIRRASLALQDAIQEFEEGEEDEEDEKILAPRSGPLNGANQSEALHDHEPHAHHNEGPIGYGEAIAWPNDQSGSHDSASSVPYNRTVTASPTQRMDTVNRLPGYVPGMHRPITPRDSATDTDTTGRSLTPQPASSTASIPSHEYISSNLSSPARTERALPQSILANKRGSITNSPLRTRPRQLSMGDLYGDAGSSSDSTQTPLKSALSDRRRPISPLADSAYASSGRSATPSNNLMDAWSPTTSSFTGSNPSSRIIGVGASVPSKEGHMRQASSASSGMETSDSYYSNQSAGRANGVTRSVMSPALPDSPTLNGSSGLANIVSSWNGATTNVIVDEPIHRTPTPSRVVSTMEIGQSMMPPHPFRSPTPSRSPVRVVSGGTPSRNTTPLPRSTTPNLHKRTHSRNGSLAIESASAGRSPRVAHFHSPSGSSSGLRQNPLMMSPMLNSSRSSLASTGSSYHSWDEDQLGGRPTHKRGVSVFIDNDTTAWKKHQSGFDFNLGTENAPDPEDIREVLAGLTKQDIAAVQERLVVAAAKKRVASITRPLSGQKKRRASASQSVTSLPSPSELEAPPPFLASSPVLAAQTPPSPSPDPSPPVFVPAPATKNTADHAMKANALLHAMMDSIESSPPPTALPPPPPQVLAAEYSFSSEEPQSTPQTATPPSTIEHSQEVSEAEPPTPDTPIPEQDPRHKALTDALFGSDSDATVKDSHPPFERSQSLRAFAMPPVVGTPPKEEGLSLAEEVERRAMAATAALKSPSTPRFTDAGTNGRKSSRKLNTRQISSPQLVSSTTSVDTIALGASNQASQPNLPHSASGPLPTVERAPQSSKLSQRIKKFTGNLRAKTPNPTGDEVSPYVIEASTPPATESSSPRQMPSFDPPTPTKPPLVTAPVGATDDSNSSAPGTPTSAPPRLRGFMARLRKGRKDSTDGRDKGIRAPSPLGPNAKPGTSPQQAPIPPPPHIPAAALRAETIPPPDNFSSSSLGGSGTDSPQNVPPPPPPPPSLPLSAPANIGTHPSSPPPQPHIQSQQGDEDAVRQLYDAALHLGLDRAVINDILVRSQSTSSRSTAWTQAQTPTTATISDPPTTPPPPALPASGLERSMSVTTPKAPRSGVMLGRQLSLKPFSPQSMLAPSAAAAPQSPSGGDGSSKASIVRRTIIFPSPSARSSPEVSRRPSTSKHRRSRSGSIHSNKSVQDRAPTPPPSRAPTNKRFSKDQSPPVPQLPSGLDGSVSAALQAPRTASGLGSVSNYDSLYDMYTENSGQPDSEAMQGDPAPTGSAVEVLELSDGQIIWSVVDGLRAAGQDDDEDDTSPFPYRMSRNSEYSMQETHELRFKEHHRTASKGSTLSAASKASKGPQSNRPETRVFFSNAGDIGQLIDNLSKSVEAGQFNILPGVPTVPNSYLRPQSGAHSAHSFNSSFNSSLPDGDWTVEERIDHMIAANRKRTGL